MAVTAAGEAFVLMALASYLKRDYSTAKFCLSKLLLTVIPCVILMIY